MDLFEACRTGNLESVKKNILNDNELESAILVSASCGMVDIVKYFIECGISINKRYGQDMTLLMYAVQSGKLELVKYLVENGAEINALAVDGSTPLISSIESGNIEIVKYLIEHGSDPDIHSYNGTSAYKIAINNNYKDIANYLSEITNEILISNTKHEKYQNLLDSGYKKIDQAGTTLDNINKWDIKELTNKEKLVIMLNDLKSEMYNGGIDYWISHDYPAKGKYDIQRIISSIAGKNYDLDYVSSEIIIALMKVAESSPSHLNEEKKGLYYLHLKRNSIFDDFYFANSNRICNFFERIIDNWDENTDPFLIQFTNPNDRLKKKKINDSMGSIKYPFITIGFDGYINADVICENNLLYSFYTNVLLALWLNGITMKEIKAYKSIFNKLRGNSNELILEKCLELVDVNEIFKMTGKKADLKINDETIYLR